MKKLSITEEELQQSFKELENDRLLLLIEKIMDAAIWSHSYRNKEQWQTPIHELLDTIWAALTREKLDRIENGTLQPNAH